MPIKVPKVVTGKWIARVIHRSKLPWGTSALYDHGRFCAFGIIAKEAGVPTEVLKDANSTPSGLSAVYGLNDHRRTKSQVVKAFCEVGDKKFTIGPWIKMLKRGAK